MTGLTNAAGYSLSVKAKNGGGEATACARTKVSPTALVDEYTTAEAEYNARRSAYEDKRDEVTQFSDSLYGLGVHFGLNRFVSVESDGRWSGCRSCCRMRNEG